MVDLPLGKKHVGCKYVFNIKYKPNGKFEKCKFKLVAQGFLQQEGVDYNEIFAPLGDNTSVSLLLAIVNQEDWEIKQMDVVTVFLHNRLEEEVNMKIPTYMEVDDSKNKVLNMKGALYGRKQRISVWGKMFEAFILKSSFK